MTQTSSPHVVIAGGGVAALETLIALRDLAGDRVDITLIAPDEWFTYRPMAVAVPFAAGHPNHYGLARIAERVQCAGRAGRRPRGPLRRAGRPHRGTAERIPYDHLVLATGARATPAYERAITFGEDVDEQALHGLLRDTEEGYVDRVAFVVPNETTWALPLYELALMTARQAWSMGADRVRFLFVTSEERPLAMFGAAASDAVAELLESASIEFIGSAYTQVEHNRLIVDPGGRSIDVDRVVSLPRLEGMCDPRRPGGRRRIHPRRRARPRGRPRGRLRRGRRHRVPDQAGRPRHPAGRRGRGDDRGGSRRAGRAAAVQARAARRAPHRRRQALHALRRGAAARASPTSRPTPCGGRPPRSRAATSPRSCSAATRSRRSSASGATTSQSRPISPRPEPCRTPRSPCHDPRAGRARADRRRRRALGPLTRRARPGPQPRRGPRDPADPRLGVPRRRVTRDGPGGRSGARLGGASARPGARRSASRPRRLRARRPPSGRGRRGRARDRDRPVTPRAGGRGRARKRRRAPAPRGRLPGGRGAARLRAPGRRPGSSASASATRRVQKPARRSAPPSASRPGPARRSACSASSSPRRSPPRCLSAGASASSRRPSARISPGGSGTRSRTRPPPSTSPVTWSTAMPTTSSRGSRAKSTS